MKLEVPRDRNGTFEPKLVRKGEMQLNILMTEVSRSMSEV